jgi:hypothetical protein
MPGVTPLAPFPVGGTTTGSDLIVFKVDAAGRLEVIQGVAGSASIPWSVRLSDGTAFYDGAKSSQLPSALVGGRLDVTATQNGTWVVRTYDGAGNALESATGAPAGTERGLIVRNIPSGTQAISAAALPLPTGAATETTLSGVLTTTAFQARINTLGQKTMANSTPVVLASDQSPLPVTLSQTTPKTFLAAAYDVVLGNNKSMLAVFNAGGSPVVIRVQRIWIVNAQTSPVTGVVASFNLARLSTSAGGTAVTPVSYDTADTLNGSVSARTGGTFTEGALIQRWKWSTDEWNVGATDIESADHVLQVLNPVWYAKDNLKPLVLRAGEGLHVKCATNTTAGSFDIVMEFSEEAT